MSNKKQKQPSKFQERRKDEQDNVGVGKPTDRVWQRGERGQSYEEGSEVKGKVYHLDTHQMDRVNAWKC